MLLTMLILVNIVFIGYFGMAFLRLHDDVKSMNDELDSLKSELERLQKDIQLEHLKKGEEFLGI